MPEQFQYPEPGWAAAGMRKVGEALEGSAKRQRKRMSVADFDFSTMSNEELQQHHDMVGMELKKRQGNANGTTNGSGTTGSR